MTGLCHHCQLLLVEMGCCKLFACIGLKLWSSLISTLEVLGSQISFKWYKTTEALIFGPNSMDLTFFLGHVYQLYRPVWHALGSGWFDFNHRYYLKDYN
jgi:hypothetical protein